MIICTLPRLTARFALIALPITLFAVDGLAQQSRRVSYHVDARSEAAYETNPRFVLDAEGAFSERFSLGADVQHQSSRTTATLTASGNATHYERVEALNRYGYLFGADVSRRMSPRLAARTSVRVASSLSRGVNTDAAGLFFFPLSLTRSREASAALSYRAGPRVTLDASTDYHHVQFPEGLLSGSSLLATHVGLTRRYAAGGDVGLRYGFERNVLSAGTLDGQTIAATWQSQSAHGAVGAGVGATRLGPAGAADARWRVVGDAAVRERAGRGLATLRYARAVSQVYGLGSVLGSDVVAAGYDVATRRGSRCLLEVHRGWFTAPSGGQRSSQRVASSGSTLIVSTPLGSVFGLEGQVFARRNTGLVSIPTRGTSVSITYRY